MTTPPHPEEFDDTMLPPTKAPAAPPERVPPDDVGDVGSVPPLPAHEELMRIPRWVLWRREPGPDGKDTKIPYSAHTGRKASVTAPRDWSPYVVADDADRKAEGTPRAFSGLGIVLVADDDLVGVDLDHCVTEGELGELVIEPWAEKIVGQLATYCELSPSGTGLRLFVRGALDPGHQFKHGGIEFYSEARYLTVTFQHLEGTPTTIRTAEELARIHAEHLPKRTITAQPPVGRVHAVPLVEGSDRALMAQALTDPHTGRKLGALIAGQWREQGYPSASEADVAICRYLGRVCNFDPERIDTLYRLDARSDRLKKWDKGKAGITYGERTIRFVCESREESAPAAPTAEPTPQATPKAERKRREPEPEAAPSVSDTVEPEPEPDAAATPYTFTPAFPPEHFVSQVVAYISARTDAALEYAELGAHVLLAAASPRIKAELNFYPNGLGTNLYALMLGESSISHRSTVKNFLLDLHRRAMPDTLFPDTVTPEAFLEQLALRGTDSATQYADEWGSSLEKMLHAKYMAGLIGHLLKIYDGSDVEATRHSKRNKEGQRESDRDSVTEPHYSILGLATPTLLPRLHHGDIESGLLPRYAIVWPQAGKPARMSLGRRKPEDVAMRDQLVLFLSRLHGWCYLAERPVEFTDAALRQLDAFAAGLRTPDPLLALMFQRLGHMVTKVAMLAALGSAPMQAGLGLPFAQQPRTLPVTVTDVGYAVQVVTRWQGYAASFVAQITESTFERQLQGALRLLMRRQQVTRSVVAQNVRVEKRALDQIEATLLDREQITVEPGPPRVWKLRA